MATRLSLPASRVRDLFYYNRETGRLHYKDTGEMAGSVRKDTRYYVITVDRVTYMGDMLIWVYFNGDAPDEGVIIHKDSDATNTRIENLGFGMKGQNLKPRSKTNTTGYVGIRRHQCGKYVVEPHFDKIAHYRGLFAELPDAVANLKAFYAELGLPVYQ